MSFLSTSTRSLLSESTTTSTLRAWLSETWTVFPPAFWYGAFAGAIGYSVSTWIGKWWFRSRASASFHKHVHTTLDTKQRESFFSLFPSTVHAVVQIVGSAYVSLYGPYPAGKNPITYFDSRLLVEYGLTGFGPTVFMGIFVGYLLADWQKIGTNNLGPLMTGHHVLASLCWTMCTSLQCMQWLAVFLQFNECSTLFVNLRQYLLTAGYASSSKEVIGASLAMFVTFGAVRVFPLPKIVYNWMTQDYTTLQHSKGTGPAIITTVFISFHVLMQT